MVQGQFPAETSNVINHVVLHLLLPLKLRNDSTVSFEIAQCRIPFYVVGMVSAMSYEHLSNDESFFNFVSLALNRVRIYLESVTLR